MNYETASDFEINKAVAEVLYPDYTWESVADLLNEEGNMSAAGWDCPNKTDQPYVYDYCNNPSDAWSIIVENKIAIYFGIDDVWEAYRPFSMRYDTADKNPLRAAMICFLKMQEVEG